MPPAARNRKTVLNSGPTILFQEKGYPGNRFFPIDRKWVYVLGDKMQLVDELFLAQKSWHRIKRASRGQRRDATDKTSIRLEPGRYVPPSPTLYQGELFFYLSPIPLGQQAIERLCDWSADERKKKRIPVEEEFGKLASLARSWSKVKGPDHAHRILWGYSAFRKKTKTKKETESAESASGFTTVRAAFNFDAEGKRINPGAGITKTPPWVHVVLLQDPEAWAEDIHEYGVSFALKLAQDYQNDPQHRKMRFVASSIATEIERNPDKALDGELLGMPRGGGKEAHPEDMAELAKVIAQSAGWTLPIVKRVAPSFVRPGQPPVRPTHIVSVDMQLWLGASGFQADGKTGVDGEPAKKGKHPPVRIPGMKQHAGRAENVADFYLQLDDCVFTAYLRNVERHLDELVAFMATPVHQLMCAEHAFATVDAPTADNVDALPDGERNTLNNSIRGMFHTCRLLIGLHLFLGGRKLIQKLSAPEKESGPYHYNLARGLFEGSQAFFTKKLWDNTVKRSIKSANLFIEATLGGILDTRFHRMVDEKGLKGLNRVYVWVDRFYSKLLGLQPQVPLESLRGLQRHQIPDYQLSAIRRRFGNYLHKKQAYFCNVETTLISEKAKIYQYQSELLEEKAKIYKRSRKTSYAKVDAFLALIDALASVDSLVEKYRRGAKMDASGIRDVVYVSESLIKTLKVVSSSETLDTTGKAFKVLDPAGKVVGVVGAYLDMMLALEKVLVARNPKLAAGHLCQALAASTAFAGTLWAAASGVSIAGPVGWLLAGAYLVGYVVGQILIWIYSFEAWKKATASSFLGKSKNAAHALDDLKQQYDTWLQLYAAYEVVLEETMRMIIKPGVIAKGDRFVCALSGRARVDRRLLPLDRFELVITDKRIIDIKDARKVMISSTKVGGTGWTNEIELKADIDAGVLESFMLAIKLHSRQRGIVMPLGDKRLEVTLTFKRPHSASETIRATGIADTDT